MIGTLTNVAAPMQLTSREANDTQKGMIVYNVQGVDQEPTCRALPLGSSFVVAISPRSAKPSKLSSIKVCTTRYDNC